MACRAARATWAIAAAFCWGLFTGSASGQSLWPSPDLSSSIGVDEADSATRGQLQRIGAYIGEQQWDEAIDGLRALVESRPGHVVRTGRWHCLALRDYCHQQIAGLPEPGLQSYRSQVDSVAKDWYEEGIAQRDEQLLLRVVHELFASSAGDDALYALGEIALERGQYLQARQHWEQIHPSLKSADGTPLWQKFRTPASDADWDQTLASVTNAELSKSWLAYPDTDLDLADVRARLVLASILEGALERAEVELKVFNRLHPQAEGRIAGRDQPLAPLLSAYLSAASSWPANPTTTQWLTFGGAPDRSATADGVIDISGPAWPAPIELPHTLEASQWKRQQFNLPQRRVGERAQSLLSFHPLVTDDLVLVNNESQIAAYDLQTGKAAFLEGRPVIYPDSSVEFRSSVKPLDVLGVPRFTMTMHGNHLFARLGPPMTTHRSEELASVSASSSLVWLDLATQGGLVQKVLPDSHKWAFDGAPLADVARVYAVMRYSDVRPQMHVACFDRQTGRMLWRQFVCSAETLARGQTDEISHTLLTLQDGMLFVSSNLGAVAALSTSDGLIRWMHLYPRASASDQAIHFYRDLNPCIYYRGTVLVAPSDTRSIYALDASTGAVIWESDALGDVVHLLGVGGGNLIATGNHVYWLNVVSGKVVSAWPDGGEVNGFGRGLLAGDYVYWPTHEQSGFRIHVFHQTPPNPRQPQARQPIVLEQHGLSGVTGGNLLLAKDRLLIAGSEKIYSFWSAGSSAAVAAEQGSRKRQ